MSSNDPGKGPPDIVNLQESFNKQQAKILALKELVRKSEAAHGKSASSAHERVKHITQRFSHLKSKARYRQQQQDRSLSELHDDPILEENVREDGPSTPIRAASVPVGQEKTREVASSEKMQLLRQQMEQNKIKMAERESSKREIEEMVSQLKAKFDITQQSLERSSELGRSMGDLSIISDVPVRGKYKSASDISFTSLNLDKEKIKFLENRVKVLEKELETERNFDVSDKEKEKFINLENKILDLEENLREKECIIEARTQAVSLMSENLSLKGKNTVDMLEDTKQEMVKMQSSFIETEDALKYEIQQLKDDIDQKDFKIQNLQEVNNILESARYDLTIKNSELESKIQDVQDYSTKLSELNKLNESLQHRISDLEKQKSENSAEDMDVAKQLNDEYLNSIKTLQEKVKKLEEENDDLKKLAQESQTAATETIGDEQVAERIKSLEATIESQREEIENLQTTIHELEEQVTEKTIEYNVLNANFSVLHEKLKATAPKSLFSSSTDEEAHIEITKLKNLLAEANKSMIKMKLKTKQLQKQVDNFKKMSDVHVEVTRLSDANEELQQKVAELEEEKGSLQLKLMSSDRDVPVVGETELSEKIQILETTCQNQTTAIALLEEQKIDMTENLHTTKQELESLKDQIKEIDKEETDRVTTQIQTTQLEEQFDEYILQIDELKNEVKNYEASVSTLQEHINSLEQDKTDLNKKVDHYIAENMELLDKIEKLNKSSSSAESIEIVEGLTQQEKLEIEEFNKKRQSESGTDQEQHDHQSTEQPSNVVMGEELSDSLTKLREESSELMHKIELFTTERREVLEKMEVLTNENHEHLVKINELNEEKLTLEENYKSLQIEKCECEEKLVDVLREKTELEDSVKQLTDHKMKLHEEINVLTKEKKSVDSILTKDVTDRETLDACQKGLEKLKNEIDNFRKAGDKSSKMNSSKKLAKEAQNTYNQMDALLKEIATKTSSTPDQEPQIDWSLEVSEVKQKCEEYQNLVEQLREELGVKNLRISEMENLMKEKQDEVENLNKEISSLNEQVESLQTSVGSKEETVKRQFEALEKSRIELERKLNTSQNEIDILKKLVTEQKEQLIAAYSEHESEIDAKTSQIEECERKISLLNQELSSVQSAATSSYENYVKQLENELRKLKESLDSSNKLLEDQSEDLSNKQDTIDTLNSQIIDLYKSLEENNNKILEKEDELLFVQDLLESNKKQYEKVTRENDENKKVVEKLLQEIHSQNKEEEHEQLKEEFGQMIIKISALEKENYDLDAKNKDQLDKLKKFAANLKKKVAQCNELEAKLKEMQTTPMQTGDVSQDEYVMKVKELEESVQKYQTELEKTKKTSEQKITELSSKLEEFKGYNQSMFSDKTIIENQYSQLAEELELVNKELDKKNSQFEQVVNENHKNLRLLEQHQLQLGDKNKEIENLQTKIVSLEAQIQEKETLFGEEGKRIEEQLNVARSDAESKRIKIEKCKALVKEKNKEIQRLNAERDSLLSQVNRQDETNTCDVKKLQEDYKKLYDEHNLLLQKSESDKATFHETTSRLHTLNEDYTRLCQELNALLQRSESEKAAFNETNSHLQALREDYSVMCDKYTLLLQMSELDKAGFHEKITHLQTLNDGIQAKHQEDMGYIESLEVENNKYKDKISRLEECVGTLEERRSSLENHTSLLDAQLQENRDEYEKNEDALIQRLTAISHHDEFINQRLVTAQEEKEKLLEQIESLKTEVSSISNKYHHLEQELNFFRNNKYDVLENENVLLQEKYNKIVAEMNLVQAQCEEKLAKKHSEIDELENELSVQLQKIQDEKRNLQERLEKTEDENTELKDELVRARESAHALEQMKNDMEREMTWMKMQHESFAQDQIELQQLRVQIIQDKTEIENFKHQIETLIQNHEIELNELRTQISEMDSMRMQVGQNQTDDQVFIETENKKLKEMLAKKDAAIENYQRENLKLQMVASMYQEQQQQQQQHQVNPNPFTMFAVPSGSSDQSHSFGSLPQSDQSAELFKLREKVQKLENDCSELQVLLQQKEDSMSRLMREIQDTKDQYNNVCLNNSELQQLCLDQQNEMSTLKCDIDKLKHPVQEQVVQPQQQSLQTFFLNEPTTSNVFEEIVSSCNVDTVQSGKTDNNQQKKIEDLQRNVSDLEKYTTDLENKLRQLTSVHEETLSQNKELMSRYEKSIKEYEERIRVLEQTERDLQTQKALERMIIPPQQYESNIPSLEMFFSQPKDKSTKNLDVVNVERQTEPSSDTDDPQPVVEELIVPKKTYLCYPEQKTDVLALDLGSEGWGWGSVEAALEEKHQKTLTEQNNAMPSATTSLENKIREYQSRVQELELERNRLEEKIVESQVLSGKLKKKLKEYRAKLDQYEKAPRQSSIESNELDLAIQEELKSQVKQLEQKLGEVKTQYEAENKQLFKRVDVLTAANERLIEMKERQDVEVVNYQTQIRNMNQELRKLHEWGDQNAQSKKHENEPVSSSNQPTETSSQDKIKLEKQVADLHHELEDLKVDRDELQAILDEERENLRRSERQIHDLQEKLVSARNEASDNQEMQVEVDILKNKIGLLEIEVSSLQGELSNKETDLSNLKLKNQNLQMQLNDYQSTIEQFSVESQTITSQLTELKDEHQKKLLENSDLTKELQDLVRRNDDLSKELETMKSSTQSTMEQQKKVIELEEKLQNLTSQLQYKDAEILHFNQRIENLMREDQTESLVQEILFKNQEITSLRQEVQQLAQSKTELENNLSLQLTNEMALRGSNTTDKDKQTLQEQIQELQKTVEEMKTEKESMENELQVLNSHVLGTLDMEEKLKQAALDVDTKNIEISELKNTLEALKQRKEPSTEPAASQTVGMDTDLTRQQHEENLRQLNSQWENVVEQRCGEVADSWRQHLNQREEEFRQQIEQLQGNARETEIVAVTPGNENVQQQEEQEETIDPNVFKNMQTALESQELEIVTLKEQLAIRSAEYARLAAQHDPFGQTTTSSVAFDKRSQRRMLNAAADQQAAASNSELDLALYMYHQRDMRCEELTLEVVNLLDERDTLQLKLSNVLRKLEEVKRKTGYSESDSESDPAPSSTNSPEKTRSRPTGPGLDDSFLRTSENLNAKLNELHSVSQARDKRQHWEEPNQYNRQLEKIREDLANIPSEAVTELVGEDISNTNESAPNLLLNWLWGKTGGSSQQS